ncbi:acyl carrier protein phosphodiesterase [Thiothrix fructosivorans]|uniref:DUF479 domain-containing protein n=1 Tax=Thiothrix fructosivorans TaxID=111770 RepID=A0A8B0SLT6_9GAMM|nr:ACP phosphodiesterase [Thiothrix fructosivorans]MBO0612491.1 DUF479 domain-containing protein [Thiothrix fructosivorans]QTX12031.1 DUF479 domain-containing protein [Thiothrix fructosivorans]
MNWLAHLHIASVVDADRTGSLLPDIVNPSNLALFTPAQQHAIKLHQAIDHFTDRHPVVQRSKTYISPPYTRFAGVLVDIFYDYCLSYHWHNYTQQPLDAFIRDIHNELKRQIPELPSSGQNVVQRMIEQQWLNTYSTHEGIQQSLGRIAQRMKRPVELAAAVELLQQHETAFMLDFQEFYPALLRHIREQ